jgi:C4-dicarboxylate transporter DctM subunit
VLWLLLVLLAGAPIFAVLGGLALALFWSEGQPLASVPLSHYQITVNPSLPALPLFTLAGLVFARSGAAPAWARCSPPASAAAWAARCCRGGGAVLLLHRLHRAAAASPSWPSAGCCCRCCATPAARAARHQPGHQRQRAGRAAGAVGAADHVRHHRPGAHQHMFLAGLLPALVMVAFLLVVGGYLRRGEGCDPACTGTAPPGRPAPALAAAWAARWEILAPLVAIGSLASGIATPTESAALTAAYAILTQAVAHRELDWRRYCAAAWPTAPR